MKHICLQRGKGEAKFPGSRARKKLKPLQTKLWIAHERHPEVLKFREDRPSPIECSYPADPALPLNEPSIYIYMHTHTYIYIYT